MKPSTILITSSGVAKLIPEGVEIPEKPQWSDYKQVTPMNEHVYRNNFQHKENEYRAALTALEKEAESWPEFVDDDETFLVQLLHGSFWNGKDVPKPGIYRKVMIPEHKIVLQFAHGDDWYDADHKEWGLVYRQVVRLLPETAREPLIEDENEQRCRYDDRHVCNCSTGICRIPYGSVVGDPAVKEPISASPCLNELVESIQVDEQSPETQEQLWKEFDQDLNNSRASYPAAKNKYILTRRS